MPFPTIPTVAAGRVLSATQPNNTALRTFPSLSGLTKNSGDLLIAICIAYQSSASAGAVFSSWGAGFTEFLDVGGTTSNMSIGAAYKVSDGTETGTFTVTQAATVTGHAAMFLLSIPGAHPSLAPVGGTITHGTTAAADIAALDPGTWGTLDTLWIAVGGVGETATTGSFTGLDAAPTNYTNFAFSGISQDTPGGVEGGVAFRQLNAASEDPGAFATVDLSNARNSAVLIAVCPAPTFVGITHAQETNSPQGVSGSTNFRTLVVATETDTVGEIVPLQTLPALETELAHQISTQAGQNITTAAETDSAQTLSVAHAVTITTATETDTTFEFGLTERFLNPATETDTAQALEVSALAISPATETDLAGDIVELQALPASETDTPQVLTLAEPELSLSPATETDTAQTLSFTFGGGYNILPASETDLANEIVAFAPLPATETDSVQSLTFSQDAVGISPVTETDLALSFGMVTGVSLTEYEATLPLPYNLQQVTIGDTSTAVELSVTTGIGNSRNITHAGDASVATGIGPPSKMVSAVLVSSTDTAQALTKYKAYSIAPASSSDSALAITFTLDLGTFFSIGPAVSTATATTLSITKTIGKTISVATEVDLARTVRAANRPTGGLVLSDHQPVDGLALIDHVEAADLVLTDV